MQEGQAVFSFDFGKASLGEAVKLNNEIVHRESLLIPEEFASIKEQRTRRRAMRTRESHKAREEWLKNFCVKHGIEILKGRDIEKGTSGNKRLEREFPAKGNNTCYTSCLLRIKLLNGEKLESWQVYKALRSAIQRRGYDTDITWSSSASDDDKESTENLKKFNAEYDKMSLNPAHRYLCYYDAWKMGLWNPETDSLKDRIDCNAGKARGYTAPRQEVEKELKELLKKASEQFPSLKGKEDFFLYGDSLKPYLADQKIEGVMGQKFPRFNNRMPDKCRLIPRLNVCSADDILVMQVTFLMKLKNMRLQRNGKIEGLNHEDLKKILSEAIEKAKDSKPESAFKLTNNQWKKCCRALGGHELSSEDLVEAPRLSGRSSFSRPALRIMKELLLSGKSPHSFHKEKLDELKAGKLKGLQEKDLSFLLKMPDDWNRIHIPSLGLEFYQENSKSNEEAVNLLINSQIDPIVRHRLSLFSKRIDELVRTHGVPEEVVMEFVRTDFMGPKAKKKYEDFQKDRRERRRKAKELAESMGLAGNDAVLKAELFIQQSGQNPYPPKSSNCVYTGACLEQTNIASWHIDHIVPRKGKYKGSNSHLNLVLTTRDANQEKADRTPFEWLHATDRWDEFLNRVNSMRNLPFKKKNRLLLESASEEDEKQTALIETAWIAKLAQALVHLKFGWKLGAEGEKRRVTVIPGALTAQIRKKYELNSILYSDLPEDMEIDELPKNRQDSRHHALDAMVLAYLPQWARDNTKREFFKFPDNVLSNPKEYFRKHIEQVTPFYICREKPVLEETFYSLRKLEDGNIITKRVELKTLPFKGNTFSVKDGLKQSEAILDAKIKNDMLKFFAGNPSREDWDKFLASYRISPNGPLVKKVAMTIGDPSEYNNMMKDSVSRGQYKRAKSHNGYFIYLDKDKPKVKPVYVFQSKNKVRSELVREGFKIHGFFYSNCLVELADDVDLGNRKIPKGKYVCSSIKAKGEVKLKGSHAYLEKTIGLPHLIKGGFRRIK